MTAVILGRDLDALRSCLPPSPEPVRYLILQESSEGSKIRAYFEARGSCTELPRANLFRERSGWFQPAYVTALGRVNVEHASRDWWAMPFTTKNPISTELCRDAFAFLLIAELARKTEGALAVVTDSEALAAQVEAWGRGEGITVVNGVRSRLTKQWLLDRLAPLAIVFLAFRALWFRLRIGDQSRMPADGGPMTVIVTLVHPHSFTADGQFCDTYFGKLQEWLTARSIPVVTAGFVQGQSVWLAQAFLPGSAPGGQVPVGAVLTVGEILWCMWDSFRAWTRRDQMAHATPVEIDGVRLDKLIRQAIRDAHASGDVFRSFYVSRCASRLAERLKITRCWYPYENRAWEKMLLLGIRAASPKTRLVGYQHASVTASHTNFLLTEEEVERTPLPDAIVTLGDVTREWLIREGRHPSVLLKTGCALRQPKAGTAAIRARRSARVTRLLLALATNLNEYVMTLAFLEEACVAARFCRNDGRELRIRPHPTIALEEAVRLLPNGRAQFPYAVSTGAAADDLAWADVVLYASSTIGLEAVGLGVPAVYLDLGDILDTDPMGGWTEFKWVVREPKDLAHALAEIEALPQEQYSARQHEGRSYADAYLVPVTDRALQVFCEA